LDFLVPQLLSDFLQPGNIKAGAVNVNDHLRCCGAPHCHWTDTLGSTCRSWRRVIIVQGSGGSVQGQLLCLCDKSTVSHVICATAAPAFDQSLLLRSSRSTCICCQSRKL